jgi:hypothetical protein
METTTAIAIKNASIVAGIHGHHWGGPRSEQFYALGEYILTNCPGTAGSQIVNPNWDRIINELGLDLGHDSDPNLRYPRTYREAQALGALWTRTGYGICVPVPDAYGTLSDTTGTGRLRWSCYADGRVTFIVSRPREDVLRVDVRPSGRIATRVTGRYYARHLDALRSPLEAIAGESAAACAIRRLALGSEDFLSHWKDFSPPLVRRGESFDQYMSRRLRATEDWVHGSGEP